jgi:NAD(P)-dependent dehydrogenase (short-subunit alcohol dehydrogenase family)
VNEFFNGKVALVTGAGSGIGLATAKAFAEESASMVLANRQEEAVRAVAEKLIAGGHKAMGVGCDVTDDAQVASMIERSVINAVRPGTINTPMAQVVSGGI